MDPITAIAIGSAISAVGAISSAKAQSQQMQSQADAANYNAIVANQNAETALQAGSANEEAQRRKSAIDMGHMRAGLAENGIGLDSGTATDLTEQSALSAEMDALNIRYQGQTQAQAYKTQSALDVQSAQQAKANASSAMTSGYLTAGATALSGYGRYSNYQARIKNPSTPAVY
jgi:hypothetical protein